MFRSALTWKNSAIVRPLHCRTHRWVIPPRTDAGHFGHVHGIGIERDIYLTAGRRQPVPFVHEMFGERQLHLLAPMDHAAMLAGVHPMPAADAVWLGSQADVVVAGQRMRG